METRLCGVSFSTLKNIWEGPDIPVDSKTAVIVPLYKKSLKNSANSYRGISLLHFAYKLCTKILRSRLEAEIKYKGIMPEGQAGCRKGRSTMNNIFILEYVVQQAKRKEASALFANQKVAFDTVHRKKLWKK